MSYSGTQTLKDAVNETFKEWTKESDTHYVIDRLWDHFRFLRWCEFSKHHRKEVKEQILLRRKTA